MKKRFTALLCALLLLTGCAGNTVSCPADDPSGRGGVTAGTPSDSGESTGARDLAAGITANRSGAPAEVDPAWAAAAADFSVRLMQAGMGSGKNVLLSPLSVLCALGMTANGAREETLAQMEAALGFDLETLNEFLYAYREALPTGETAEVHLADSLWFTDADRFTVNRGFLQTNADWYGAGVYEAPFDQSTCDDINAWVSEHTDGMIGGILDRIPDNVVMYLINALAFDGKWEDPYTEDQVYDGQFTTEDGQVRDVELMWSGEELYLEDQGAEGFLKLYEDGRYAFAALLPEEGTTAADYVSALTGERLAAVLTGARPVEVYAAIPAFESEYSTDLAPVLAGLGMPDAFDEDLADFSGLGSSQAGNIFITQVLHKTYIAVDEQGTRAAAVTAVAAGDSAAAEPPQEIVLDRPFVYLIIDTAYRVPLFIGIMADPVQ